tara:strand:+ start:233 stop:652 length:420 start_codon:yes stop_codon:yes gene_type:complete
MPIHQSFLLFISLFLIVSCGNSQAKKENQNFKSKWVEIDPVNGSDFKIELEVKNDSIWGKYCAISNFGNRIDCSTEDELNIKGKINGNSAEVTFYSFYGAKNGKALLLIKGNQLTWKITQWPTGNQVIAPEKAELAQVE